MNELGKVIAQVTRLLSIQAGFCIIVPLVFFPLTLFMFSDSKLVVPMLIFYPVMFGVGILLALLANGFRKLRPWAYRPAYFLVGIDWSSRLLGLRKKLEDPEVRRAFGLEPV